MNYCIVRGFLILVFLHDSQNHDLLSMFRGEAEMVAPDETEPGAAEALALLRAEASLLRGNRSDVAVAPALNASGGGGGARRQATRRVATCYDCNMVDARGRQIRGIPADSQCHDAWASSDSRHRRMATYFRVHCYYRPGGTWETKFETRDRKRYDRNPMRGLYGNFMGGCFKRYVDVGTDYTVRGCRLNRPTHWAGGFAADRFRFLELLLRGRTDACIASPHASLTPFSRGVSLYVRYHVCVCSGKFCNAAPAPPPEPPGLLLIYTFVLSRLYFCCFTW